MAFCRSSHTCSCTWHRLLALLIHWLVLALICILLACKWVSVLNLARRLRSFFGFHCLLSCSLASLMCMPLWGALQGPWLHDLAHNTFRLTCVYSALSLVIARLPLDSLHWLVYTVYLLHLRCFIQSFLKMANLYTHKQGIIQGLVHSTCGLHIDPASLQSVSMPRTCIHCLSRCVLFFCTSSPHLTFATCHSRNFGLPHATPFG